MPHCTSLFDRLGYVAQTATTTGIRLLAPALTRSYAFRDYPLNISVALEGDVFSDSLVVIAEAIAKRDWLFRFLDTYANRKQVLRDDMIADGRDVNYIAIPSIAEIVGLRAEGRSILRLD